MGIYDVTPGDEEIDLVKPIFKDINVKIHNESLQNIRDLSNEGYLSQFNMLGSKFNEAFNHRRKQYYNLHTLPVIESEGKSFKDKQIIKIITANKDDKIYYSFERNGNYKEYSKPIQIDNSTTIYSYSEFKYSSEHYLYFVKSDTISATYFKKPNNYTIDIKSTYNPQYHAGGKEGLLDGINGTTNWRKGDWQGYQSQDFEAVVDLQNVKEVSNFSATFLQDQRSWILMPTKVEYYSSTDNINFTLITSVENDIDPKKDENTIKDFSFTTSKPINARYIKVKAYNYGKLPEWHLGFPYNGDAFIFIDEISFENKIKSVSSCSEIAINFGSPLIQFETNGFKPNDKSLSNLNFWCEQLKKYPSMKIEIRSHSDLNEDNIEKLSQKRGQTIYNYLVKDGISKDRLKIKSFSDSQPIFDCKTKECNEEQHQQNRRCEIIITEL
jgi:outer membrane protein OmpA-like peptidoglycan-associated protein